MPAFQRANSSYLQNLRYPQKKVMDPKQLADQTSWFRKQGSFLELRHQDNDTFSRFSAEYNALVKRVKHLPLYARK